MIEEQKAANEQLGIDHSVEKVLVRRGAEGLDAISFVNRPFRQPFNHDSRSSVKQFAVTGKPLDIMKLLYIAAKESGQHIQISESKWKFSFPCLEQLAQEPDEETRAAEAFKI